MTLQIVNMIPKSLSGEAEQDSEPNIAVNPEHPEQIVATAFTLDPMNGDHAPVYVSSDAGATWSLRSIVPGGPGTADITVGFGSRGGALYAGILNYTTTNLNVLRTANSFALTPMTVLVDRPEEDQPWVNAMTAHGSSGDKDQVYVGHNDFNAQPATASVELSRDARGGAPPGGFKSKAVEGRATVGQEARRPPGRAVDGTVYVAFQRWIKQLLRQQRPQHGRSWSPATTPRPWRHPFRDLVDGKDGKPGVRVARTAHPLHGQRRTAGPERIGADLAIAIDPSSSDNVWLAWCERDGGATYTDWTMHVARSTDRGQTGEPTCARSPTPRTPRSRSTTRARGVHVPAARRRRSHRAVATPLELPTMPSRARRRPSGPHTANAHELHRDSCPTSGTTSGCWPWATTSTACSRGPTGPRRPTSPAA